MKISKKHIKAIINEVYQSHTFEPSEGDSVVNVNKNCKHLGSEGTVLSISELPEEQGKVVEYECTNSGDTWTEGDILKKTMDQLSPMVNPAGRGYTVRKQQFTETKLRLYIRALLGEVNEYVWNKADRKTMGQDGKAKGRQKKNWVGQDTNDVITNWYKKMGLAEALGLLNESVEFYELDSPLKYSRSGRVKRIAYCDTSVTEPPKGNDPYFKEYQEMERYGKSGRRLKKPRKGELIPGVSNVCIIGFLDYHFDYENSDGSTSWYIDYIKNRGDSRGQGTASKLVDYFYENVVQPGDSVHFGKMMHAAIGHLKDKMVDEHPDVTTIGARNY